MTDLDRFAEGDRLDLYRRMLTIRRFEEAAADLYREGEIPGFVHVSIGQEATAVGACWSLRSDDGIVSTHRGHGHCLAKGADLGRMLAELMGRRTGTCGGMGGSMHIADVSRGIYGANGIVAAGLPIACGVAAAMCQRKQDGVVVAFFGDGAVAQGAFHEAMNLAAVWKLPVIFFCENNGYAEFSPFERQHRVSVADRAASYGMGSVVLDGNDVEAVARSMARLVDERRSPDTGPVLVEAVTYRHHGHYEGDPQRYRTQDELEEWKGRDPLIVLERRLLEDDVAADMLAKLDSDIAGKIADAIDAARSAPRSQIEDARAAILAARSTTEEDVVEGNDADGYRVMDAVRDALEHAMEDDDDVWLAGIDVEAGNIFGVTRGLAARFPSRVLDTPISETAILGCGVGAAMGGTRPVVELMYLDFLGVCFDQLLNQAAKMHSMTGGQANVPMVVRTQFGAGHSSGAQHSQSLEALLAHIPGLTVVMPSTPTDTYGLLRAAIDDDNPVVVIDHRLLYAKKGAKPTRGHRVPIGKGVIRRPGRHVTVATWSRMVDFSMEAADQLAAEGTEVEVIDLRTVSPLDVGIVAESVSRTGRLLIVHEAVITGGLGAELAAQIGTACFWSLDAPIVRLAPEFLPVAYAPDAEHAWLLDAERISEAIRELRSI